MAEIKHKSVLMCNLSLFITHNSLQTKQGKTEFVPNQNRSEPNLIYLRQISRSESALTSSYSV